MAARKLSPIKRMGMAAADTAAMWLSIGSLRLALESTRHAARMLGEYRERYTLEGQREYLERNAMKESVSHGKRKPVPRNGPLHR